MVWPKNKKEVASQPRLQGKEELDKKEKTIPETDKRQNGTQCMWELNMFGLGDGRAEESQKVMGRK